MSVNEKTFKQLYYNYTVEYYTIIKIHVFKKILNDRHSRTIRLGHEESRVLDYLSVR